MRQYLVETQGLPEALVAELHRQGAIYADGKQNAVFVRQNQDGEITGASLRGTYQDSQFKGLATGTRRDEGWFTLTIGQGQLERIVLVESPIDAMSAAALGKHHATEKTIFISTDGAEAVPTELLHQLIKNGGEVILAHDADRAGELRAWSIAQSLRAVSRDTPALGHKDWNEQLLGDRLTRTANSSPDFSEWQRVATALGKPEAYQDRIEEVAIGFRTSASQSLSPKTLETMQQDLQAFKLAQDDLWQWHQAASSLGKTNEYLHRITEMAISFNALKAPPPIPSEIRAAMQAVLATYRQIIAVKTVSQLNDRDFLRLRQSIVEYFNASPPQPPSLSEQQLVRAEVDKLATQLDHLWDKHGSQMNKVKEMQNSPFRAWDKNYQNATEEVSKTLNLISQCKERKELHESQLKGWDQQGEVLRAWENAPRTIEKRELAKTFKLPQMQERLTQIQQELQQQAELRRNQPPSQQRRTGRGR